MMNPWTFSASWAGLALIATQLAVWSWFFAALVAVATAARCPAFNYGWDRIFSSPTSSARGEVTGNRSDWGTCCRRGIGGRDGKPCFCRISENSGGL